MVKNTISINKKSLFALILCIIMLFSVLAPTVSAVVESDDQEVLNQEIERLKEEIAAEEKQKQITGEIIDFSKLNFEDNTQYGNLETEHYLIKREGKNYNITLSDLTAKKIVLPPDDADKGGKKVTLSDGTSYSVPAYSGKDRESYITIKLIGNNKVTGYGIEGYPVRGIKIEGSGDLSINAFSQPTAQIVNGKVAERTDYVKAGISVETGDRKYENKDVDEYNDKNSLVFAGTGNITINAPSYHGIINNGDIKFKSGNIKIEAKRTAISGYRVYIDDEESKDMNFGLELSAGDRAFYEKPILLGNNYNVLAGKSSNREDASMSTKQDVQNSYKSYRYVGIDYLESETNKPVFEEGTVENGGIYCSLPVVTVSDDTAISTITVNGSKITSGFIVDTAKKKSFTIPKSNNIIKEVVATDIFGNDAIISFTAYEFHQKAEPRKTAEVLPTCTQDGYHMEAYYCSICGEYITTVKVKDPALGHTFNEWEKTEIGKKHTCSTCGLVEEMDTRKDIGNTTISLSTSKYLYDGNEKEPAVAVKDGNQKLLQGKDYTVSYNNNLQAGNASVRITGINDYKNTVSKSFAIVKKDNAITASNVTKKYSTNAQSFSIGATQIGDGTLTYSSNNKDVTVNDSGMVTIKGGFAGNATITITANESRQYNKASKQITIAVNGINNAITASNFTKAYSAKTQSFSIGAKQLGNAKLTYSSNNKNVTVNNSGVVTIKGGFAGKATITITASETSQYNKATKQITVTVNRANNAITASNFTKAYSAKAQSFSIGARQTGNAKLTYKSNTTAVTVNSSGVATIKGGFAGKAIITITANETTQYNKATKQITITVGRANNAITASNFTKAYSAKAQSFSIGARQTGNAKLTYSSNNKSVTVNSSGKVTIAKGFIGKAIITITANETTQYNKAVKQITITVNPPAVKLSKLSNSSSKKMTIKWNKSTAVTGYEIQYSTDKNFKKGVKTLNANNKNTTSKTVSKLTKKKKYYVRIRTYKTVSGVKYYSGWSASKNISIKK